MDSILKLAFSPCPNDTFMFNAIASGSLALPGFRTEVHIHDVETLNQRATLREYDITKLSVHACLKVKESYTILHSGAALGFGCGPIVVCRNDKIPKDLSSCSIAVPGELTTAYLLFQLRFRWFKSIKFMPFDKITESVISGDQDVGVLIHEGRFTYARQGLHKIEDLGEWWQNETGLPLPLGCIAAKKEMGVRTIQDFDSLLRKSIEMALANPSEASGYIKEHAQEFSDEVLRKHIETFVNDFSIEMGDAGWNAIRELEMRSQKAGLI